MDFDLKPFFKDPPRIRDEVRRYIHLLATNIVERIAYHAQMLEVDRMLPRHVRMIIIHMTQDPLTRMNRNGLCIQHTKVKTMSRVFQRALDDAETNLKTDSKYAGIDRKIVKGSQAVLTRLNLRFSAGASVCIAACVAEICGIILNSTHTLMEDRTVSLSALQTYGTTHCLSSGEKCVNSSLVRFIHSIFTPPHPELFRLKEKAPVHAKQPPSPAPPAPKHKIARESPSKKLRRLESKSVSFHMDKRPTTPDICFWED